MTNDFYKKLKETVNFLQNEIELQSLSQSIFLSKKDTLNKKYADLKKIQKQYYSCSALLWADKNKDIDFPSFSKKEGNGCLPEDLKFLNTLNENEAESFFEKLKKVKPEKFDFQSAVLPLFLSPLSVNYFHKSFNDVLKPYFLKEEPVPEDIDSLKNILFALHKNLSNNISSCPFYLIRLFKTINDKTISEKFNITASKLFSIYVLNKCLKMPDIFGFQYHKDENEDISNRFNNLLDVAKNIDFCQIFSMLFTDFEFRAFNLLNLPKEEDNEAAFAKSSFGGADADQSNYRQLLKICPRLPDKLPSKLESENYSKIVQALVLRPGPFYYKRKQLYNQISETSPKFFSTALEGMNVSHDSEAIARMSKNEQKINQLTHITNKILTSYKLLSISLLANSKSPQRNPIEYIENPKQIIKFINEFLNQNKDQNSQIFTVDSVYKNAIFSINFNDFCQKRPSLEFADKNISTYLLVDDGNVENTGEVDDENVENKSEVDDVRKVLTNPKYQIYLLNFCKILSNSSDPLSKVRDINKTYKEILNILKFVLGVDVDASGQFIKKLFTLMKPQYIVSNYVYLSEFVFGLVGSKPISESLNTDEKEAIKRVKKIFESLLKTLDEEFFAQCTLFTRVYQRKKEINVLHSPNELEKLAILSNQDFQFGFKNYEEILSLPETKSQIEFFKRLPEKYKTTIRIFDNENYRLYIYTIIFSKDKKVEPLPTTRKELIDLGKKENK